MVTTAMFGRTGHQSSRVIFGAAGIGSMRQEKADQVLSILLERGVNHIDTAASYGDSELRLAPFLAQHRDAFFLATKTGDRTGDAARASLERSLTRMGVDHVDLIQFHNLVEDDEWDVVHTRGGALDAMTKARDEGLVRFIGVTGHGTRIPRMHIRSLERFGYDTVLFPYNFPLLQLDFYRRDVEELLGLCEERNVAVQTIKSVARRRWQDNSEPHFSWYQPLPAGDALTRAVRFVLSQPRLFLNSSSDARLLPAIVDAATADDLSRPRDDEMAADVAAHDMAPLFDGADLERI